MTKIIIMPNSNLDSFYERTIQELHDRHMSYPTSLSGIPVTAEEQVEISNVDGLGRYVAGEARHGSGGHYTGSSKMIA